MKLISRGIMFDWTVSRMLGIVKLIHHSGWRMRSHKIMRIRVSFDLFVFNCLVFTSNRVPCFICFRHLWFTPVAKVKTNGVSRFRCTNGSWHAHVAPTILTRRTPQGERWDNSFLFTSNNDWAWSIFAIVWGNVSFVSPALKQTLSFLSLLSLFFLLLLLLLLSSLSSLSNPRASAWSWPNPVVTGRVSMRVCTCAQADFFFVPHYTACHLNVETFTEDGIEASCHWRSLK